MGNPSPLPQTANQTSFEYTSTRSSFEFDVGGLLSLKVNFLSPISPNDLLRQSAPVSYLSITVTSKDDKEHDVQIYTDVSAGMYLRHGWKQNQPLIALQNGPAETDPRRSSGRTTPLTTRHTTDLLGRRKHHSANRATKPSGETGTTRHRLLTA